MSSWQKPALGIVASSMFHVALALLLLRLPAADASLLASPLTIEVLEGSPEGAELGQEPGTRARDAEELRPGGEQTRNNIDAPDRGQGGERLGAMQVVLLMERDLGIRLQDTLMNAPNVWQTQRIRTARDRATRENRRSTPNPDDQVFLASGDGRHRERRPVSRRDARTGARTAPSASVVGSEETRAEGDEPMQGELVVAEAGAAAPDEVAGREEASPGRGIQQGQGARTNAADVAHGRPTIDRGPAATLAGETTGRIRDDVDSELLAAGMVQSLVDSTERRGQESGEGAGGLARPGAPGTGGGQRAGGRASAHGPGDGRFASLDTRDARYRRWYVQQRRRVANALEYPRARALALDQGLAVYRVAIRRNGTLAGTPQLIRTSGFPDLDAAARVAIEQSAPFDPLPEQLAPGRDPLGVRLAVTFSNPMVR